MTAKSVVEEVEKEKIVDNVSDQMVTQSSEVVVDMSKLAALKAKNQAKQMEQKLTKTNLKKERSIVFGVVGTGQGGCIESKTNIYVSKHGIISIEKFFNEYLLSTDFKNIEVIDGKGTCIHLDDQDIYTVSIDPETSEIKKGKILAVWKNGLKPKNKITTSTGASLTSSKTHPSLVFRPNINKKAFFQNLKDGSNSKLIVGDNLVDTRLEILDQISEKQYIRNIEVTNDIAWLLGVFAGDGHDALYGNSLHFFSSNKKLTDKIVRVVKTLPHTSISVYDKPGCANVSVFGLNFRLFIESAFEFKNSNTYGGMGNKTFTISVPKCVSAAGAQIRASFLAGLIDSDGTVGSRWCESSIFTCSYSLADTTMCLISSIGGRASLINVKASSENESDGYNIKIYGKLNFGTLGEFIISQIGDSNKNKLLTNYFNKDQKSFTNSVALIPFNHIKKSLIEAGMTSTNSLMIKSKTTSLKQWVRGERRLSIPTFNKVIDALKPSDDMNYFKKITPKLSKIESIETTNEKCMCYDLTVEKYENYVAGNNGFIFTHNSNLAGVWHKLGYNAVACNTASQDLKHLDLPDDCKLLFEYGLGGAAKEMEIGRAAAELHRSEITQLINEKLESSQVNILCLSLGGGSGAGSCEVLVDILSATEKPLVVMAVLPMDAEDAQTKHNALETLAKLAKLTQNKKVHNLIVVDNAKIEVIYQNVSQMEFFNVANKAIVEPLDIFNTLSATPSSVKPLDPMEFSKLLIDGEGLSVYGELTIENFREDTAIAEAVVSNLNSNLLAGGFDLTQSKYVGIIIAANKEVWQAIPSSSVNYAMAMVNENCGSPKGVFKGIYTVDMPENVVKVYSFFSGLSLPNSRVEQLKKESKELMQKAKVKDEQRNLSLSIDTGTNETVSLSQKVKDKIAANSSAHGKMIKNIVSDRRK